MTDEEDALQIFFAIGRWLYYKKNKLGCLADKRELLPYKGANNG